MLLLVVGLTKESLIESHKRTRNTFTVEHYRKLFGIIAGPENMATTTNIMTEVSNLAALSDDQTKFEILTTFARIISVIPEIHLSSQLITKDPVFLRLGLTDALILKLKRGEYHLLTTDSELHYECFRVGLPTTNMTQFFFY